MRLPRRQFLHLALLGMLTAATPACAQNYPSRPIKLVVPFPPGGLVDVTARLVAQKLAVALGQPVVVENRTGASGTVGADSVVKSQPDGYMLLFSTGDFLTSPAVLARLPFDPHKDIMPIMMVARSPLTLVANGTGPIDSIPAMIAAAKADPGKVAFGSPGLGSLNHLAGEWMGIEAGVKLLHVPYRGGAPAVTGVATGEIAMAIVTPPTVQSLIEAKKVRLLGLMTKDRASFVPDWPTLAEAGLKNIDAAVYVGIYAPAGTPPAIVSRIEAEVTRLLVDEDIKKRFNDVGADVTIYTGQAFADRIKIDAARYKSVVDQVGIKISE
jgi:tripartite-type tricarboxylate transporter receptor subunit TctC